MCATWSVWRGEKPSFLLLFFLVPLLVRRATGIVQRRKSATRKVKRDDKTKWETGRK